jgi:hypothetical protein
MDIWRKGKRREALRDSRSSAPGGHVPPLLAKACCNPKHHRLQGPVVWTEVPACKKGHLLTPDNVVTENRNRRLFNRCRICLREAWKGWQKQHSSPAEGGKKKEG